MYYKINIVTSPDLNPILPEKYKTQSQKKGKKFETQWAPITPEHMFESNTNITKILIYTINPIISPSNIILTLPH
jgi:hypothetical protein